jgi:hypothetical protein
VTFTVVLFRPAGGATLGTPSVATVTILANSTASHPGAILKRGVDRFAGGRHLWCVDAIYPRHGSKASHTGRPTAHVTPQPTPEGQTM